MPAYLQTPADVKQYALDRASDDVDETSDYEDVLNSAMVEVWRDLVTRHPWLSLQKFPPGVLLTAAAITILTVTGTAGTTALTLSSAHASSLAEYVVIPTGQQYMIRITAHTAATDALTVDAIPEDLAGVACVIAKVEYDLPADCGPIIGGLWVNDRGASRLIPIRHEEVLRAGYPDPPDGDWPPDICARVGLTKIRLSSYPSARQRIEVPYIALAADPDPDDDTTVFTLAPNLVSAYAEGVLALLYETFEDSRRPVAEARYERGIDQAKEYEHLLRAGMGGASNQRSRGPYSD